jgi:hypothetical protein
MSGRGACDRDFQNVTLVGLLPPDTMRVKTGQAWLCRETDGVADGFFGVVSRPWIDSGEVDGLDSGSEYDDRLLPCPHRRQIGGVT